MLDQPLQKLNRIEKATKVIIKDYKITAGLFFSICITSLFLIALPLQQPISLHVMVLVFILVTSINSLYFGWQSGFTSLLFGCILFCSMLAFQSPTNSTSLNLNLSVTGGFLVVFFAVLLFISQRTLKKEMLYIEGQQQSISESDYLLRSLAENIESVFWVTDPKKSQVYYVSPAFQDVFERSPDSIYKNSNKYIDFIHPEDKPKMIQLMQESNTDARSSRKNIEYRIVCPSGEVKWVHSKAFPVVDRKTGEVIQVVGLLTDISTKKQQESLLKKKNEELVSTNKDLEDFVSVASHDLQEPLRKIRTNCDILKDQIDPKDSSIMTLKTLDFICASTKRMQALITSLLNYSKLEHQGCHLEPVDLNLALKESLETLSLKINETQSSIVCPSRLPTIMAEKTSSSMLFKNLIENAIKYRSQNETPEITISTLEKKDNWEIAIHDNGIGIDVKHHEDVFKIFQRLHNKKDYPGTGVGLAICRKTVERYHGKIWVESNINGGTSIIIRVPRMVESHRMVP